MKRLLTLSLLIGLTAQGVLAGNDTKRGQAGASELLINPWARSTGWNGANVGNVRGLESINLNIAGLAYVRQSDFMFCSQRYLSGSGMSINSAAFGQRLSPTGVLGLSITSLSLGEFKETTYASPEGTGNNFTPTFFNFSVSYSNKFSDRISGGVLIRGIYQGIANASSFGVAFDGGVQYQGGGDRNPFKFGVTLRNVGPKMQFDGEGLSFKGQRDYSLTLSSRTNPYEMPALLGIGTSYDIYLAGADALRLTPAFTFTSNSYTKDNLTPGLELAFKEMFMVRGSYNFHNDLLQKDPPITDVYTGWAAGATIEMPLAEMFGQKSADEYTSSPFSTAPATDTPDAPETATDEDAVPKKKSNITVGIDYSYRPTNPYAGTHAVGLVVKF